MATGLGVFLGPSVEPFRNMNLDVSWALLFWARVNWVIWAIHGPYLVERACAYDSVYIDMLSLIHI